jgi:hypothetical protein
MKMSFVLSIRVAVVAKPKAKVRRRVVLFVAVSVCLAMRRQFGPGVPLMSCSCSALVDKGGYQFNYLSLETIPSKSFWSPSRPTHVMNARLVHEKVQALLHGYDFIMVVERMDESLTALALLTGLRLGDVLTPSSAKVAGDYRLQRIGRKKGQCHYQRKGTMSDGVRRYFNSHEWLAMNYADEILYRAANASLDMTIDQTLGRDRFDVALVEYRRLQKKVTEHCGQRLGSGCTADGQVIETQQEECYDRDFGCGFLCVDDFLMQERRLRMNLHAELAPGVMI